MKEKIVDLFNFSKKSKIKAGEGMTTGEFPFYTSSPFLTKWIDDWQHNESSLIFGTGGVPSVHFSNKKFSTSTDCIVITRKKEVELNEKFVYYYLSGNIHIIERGFKGAGLKHISKKYIQNIEIPLYSIERQNEIVVLLDKINSLIFKRNETLEEIDRLLESRFYNLFGDSFNNTNNYKTKTISEICSAIIDCPHSTPKYVEEKTDYPCIRTSEIKGGEIVWDSMKYLDYENHVKRISRLEPEENDIVFGREGSVGDSALITSNLNISLGQRVMLFRVNNEIVTPEYFWALIRSNGIQFKIKTKTIGATVKRINISEVKKIECPIPPLNTQKEFSLFVKKIKAFKIQYLDSKNNTDDLFKSLIQRAFSGEINIDEEIALESLLDKIDLDLDIDKKDISNIATAYLRELVEKINERDFEDLTQYRKAKKVAFELLESGDLSQRYNENFKSVELIINQ